MYNQYGYCIIAIQIGIYNTHINTFGKMFFSDFRSNLRTKNFVSILLIVFLCACSNDNEYYHVDSIKELHIGFCEDTIKGELFVSSDTRPNGIERRDSILIVMGTSYSQNLFDFYNVKSKEKILSFGRIGHARNEFINAPVYSYFDINGDDLMLYFPDENSTKVLNFKETIKQKKGIFEKPQTHKYDGENYFFINKDTVIVRKSVSYIDPRDEVFFPPNFTIYTGNTAKNISIYPKIIKSNNYGLLHFLYSSIVRVKPDKTKIVESLCLLDIINIIDIKTGKVVGIKESNTYGFEDIEKKSKDPDIERKVNVYTHGMYLTDKHIFLLQDRCTVSELRGNEVSSIPTLLVLDWDGELTGMVCLDKDIYSFVCDEEASALYGFDGEGSIYKYNIYKYLNK